MKFAKPEFVERRHCLLVYGAPVRKRVKELGVYDPNGDLVPHADIRADILSTAPPVERPEPARFEIFRGPAMFAGLGHPHFGHAITCSLGRLWATSRLGARATLLYAPRRRGMGPGAILPLNKFFGVENPVRMISGPMRVRRFFAATDLFGERYGGRAAPEFRAWVRQRVPQLAETKTGAKLYVTRSAIKQPHGRYACEKVLEENLAKDGYEIYSPQFHTLEEQTAKMQAAETLVFAEGSAIHFFAFLKRPHQRVMMIQRRPDLPHLLRGNVTAFDDTPAHFVNVIRQSWYPPTRKDNHTVAELDFDRLRDELVAAGALSSDAPWREPTAEELSASLSYSQAKDVPMLTEFEFRRRKKAGELISFDPTNFT